MQGDHTEACADRGQSCTTFPSTVGLIAEGGGVDFDLILQQCGTPPSVCAISFETCR